MVVDTRVITARDDAKAGAAALDDARCALHELLSEGPPLQFLDREALELNLDVVNKALSRVDAVIGSLDRIADRWTA
ncbi:hypothetical protein M609_gp064 [Mycobacterium phage Job42]|uniref:Uncharacterized protein n=25 Tax=Gracegardnervirinae TaxID=2946632 RepID=Q855E3_9CAUD|nr:hypothetical protein PBI_CHE8_67 [Mycobacterium phage Che8]NP_818043.1 hypothetical protein PBI_CHE9D_70 [Mycobacterium phage Che9d]YP_008126654.1 hypothetical protein M609_gp064 [Mycobacterium phage Job42]YP_009007531.1 hypothetical protein PBI_SAAL_64 [Mycobacterium phage Saal]YP_009013165.1 hypothetical protein CL78_gp070 [Mycobacterium phage Avani]YP_009018936.1 hypothetical protein CL77_gp060 [Mycobacterium phage GUmbie]YP_009125061.1 hypothetical protein PBI_BUZZLYSEYEAR_68 [Mycobact